MRFIHIWPEQELKERIGMEIAKSVTKLINLKKSRTKIAKKSDEVDQKIEQRKIS